MKRRTILVLFLLCSLLILLRGVYNIYVIFYSSYLDVTAFEIHAFKENVPTKLGVLFSGFKDYKTVLISGVLSITILYLYRKMKKRSKHSLC